MSVGKRPDNAHFELTRRQQFPVAQQFFAASGVRNLLPRAPAAGCSRTPFRQNTKQSRIGVFRPKNELPCRAKFLPDQTFQANPLD